MTPPSHDGQIDSEIVTHLLDIKAELSKVAEGQRALRNELFADNGHITRINKHIQSQDTRFWISTVVIAPFLTVAHMAARKLGWDV